MSYVRTSGTVESFEHQADVVLNQVNPVSGTKYTVLNTTPNARIISIVVTCTWTVQPTPLEIHVTIDGQAYTFYKDDPATVTFYEVDIHGRDVPLLGDMEGAGAYQTYRSFLLEGRSVKIEAEITGGTVTLLYARVKYAKK